LFYLFLGAGGLLWEFVVFDLCRRITLHDKVRNRVKVSIRIEVTIRARVRVWVIVTIGARVAVDA
jgi:hypothetical protein